MTGKERILCTLKGEKADRVPVALFVQEDYLSWYYGRDTVSRVTDAVKLSEELDFDVMTRATDHIEPYYTRRSFPNWEVSKKSYIDGGNLYRSTVIATPKGNLEQVEAAPYDPRLIRGTHLVTKKHFLDSSDAFEIFKTYLPSVDSEYINDIYEKARWSSKVIGDRGIACPWGTGGVYNTAASLRNVEDLMMDPYDEDSFYEEMMELITEILEKGYDILSHSEYLCLGMQGNIANAGLIGSDHFDNFILPYEKRLIDIVKSNGKSILYHNCGLAKALYPCYLKLKMTVFETLSPVPQGDNSLAEAKEMLGKEIVLAGNLDQVNFLKQASQKEVEEKTREIVQIGKKGGRYIFATSDYLESGTPLENIKIMVKAAKETGAY